jgi:hypothetical protein
VAPLVFARDEHTLSEREMAASLRSFQLFARRLRTRLKEEGHSFADVQFQEKRSVCVITPPPKPLCALTRRSFSAWSSSAGLSTCTRTSCASYRRLWLQVGIAFVRAKCGG